MDKSSGKGTSKPLQVTVFSASRRCTLQCRYDKWAMSVLRAAHQLLQQVVISGSIIL